MLTLFALLVSGLFTAVIFALCSLAFTVSYSATHDFHIAQGAVFAIGGYVTYACVNDFHLSIPLSLVIAVLVGAGLGVLIEVLLYSRLRRSSGVSLGLFLASLGLLTLLTNMFVLIFGVSPVQPNVAYLGNTVRLGLGVNTTVLHIISLVLAVFVIALIEFLYRRTKLGKVMRAVSDSPYMARCIGISVPRAYIYAYALASGIAALAGGLLAFEIGASSENAISITLIAIMVVLLTGTGHFVSSFVTAMVVGLFQSLILISLPEKWIEVIVYSIFLALILFRPNGIVSKGIRAKGV